MEWQAVPFKLTLGEQSYRSPGLHVSEIYRDLAIKSSILDQKWSEEDMTVNPERIVAGLAWEEWVCRQHPEILYHPGELSLDGVACSPDGVSSVETTAGIVDVVHEFKFTWKSQRREQALDQEWLWMTQIKAYCHVVGTTLAFLHVYWVNGDYTDRTPRYKVYSLAFQKWEVTECWDMLMRHKRRMELEKQR